MDYNPTTDLVRLGYTPRESAFLQLVAFHSGYFLRRQFTQYIDKKDGGLAHYFVMKGQRFGHLSALPMAQSRLIFHLHSKYIYRICGVEQSQNRRAKGDRTIKTSLMALDFVLEHPKQHFFRTQEEKVRFFSELCTVPQEKLPRMEFASPQGGTVTSYFPDRFPISQLSEPGSDEVSTSFCFIDDGIKTAKPFSRFLDRYEQLLLSIPFAEIVYAAETERFFADANRLVQRKFPQKMNQESLELFPHGIDHFFEYLRLRNEHEDGDEPLSEEDYAKYFHGNSIYDLELHDELYKEWADGELTVDEIREQYGPNSGTVSFRSYVVRAQYPKNAAKLEEGR